MPNAEYTATNPYNETTYQAERSVIAGVLSDPRAYETAGLSPEHFYNPGHRSVWQAIGSLRGSGSNIDAITLSARIGLGLEASGGLTMEWINGLFHEKASPGMVQQHAAIVRDEWLRRTTMLKCSEILQSKAPGKEMYSMLRNATDLLARSQNTKQNTLYDAVAELKEYIASGTVNNGLPTGIGLENILIGGIPRGVVTTIYAETGNFKTTIKHKLVREFAKAGHRVLDLCYEDGKIKSAGRLMSIGTGIPMNRIVTNILSCEERKLIADFETHEWASLIDTGDDIANTADEVVRAQRARPWVSVVVIDYIQQIRGTRDQKYVTDDAMLKFQAAAKRDNVAYIVISQRKQESTNKAKDYKLAKDWNPRPGSNEHLAGSSGLRECSKAVIGLYYPYGYDKKPTPNGPNSYYAKLISTEPNGYEIYKQLIEVHVTKNSLGEPGWLTVRCDLNTGEVEYYNIKPYLV